MGKDKFPQTPDGDRAWFARKKIGYGWGLPVTWQGWLVFSGYLISSVAGAVLLSEPPGRMIFFFLYFIPLTLGFIYICWKKGEKQES